MKNIIDLINRKKILAILVIVLFSVISCLFLFHNGLILGHDLEYHLSRIDSIAKCIKIHDFRALIHEGVNGYGYANGLCYSNLFLYPAALLVVLGIGLIDSYKIYVILFSILTGLAMYYPVKKITKSNFSAMISSILYLICSYRICDVMVRGALGESLSFIFMPIIILGLYYIVYDNYKKFWIFSLGFVGLINCHLVSTVIMAIISIIFLIINYEKLLSEPKRVKYLMYSGILGLLLGAFFIFPMLQFYISSDILIKSQMNQSVSTMTFYEALCGIPKFTTRFVAPGIGFIFIYFLYCRIRIKIAKKDDNLSFFDLCNAMGIILLICSTSFLPWKELSEVLGFVQFSWRIFVPVCAFFAFSAGIVFERYIETKKYKTIVIITVIVLMAILACIYQVCSVRSIDTYWEPSNRESYITKLDEFTMAAGEYLPVRTDWSKLYLEKRQVRITGNKELKASFKDNGSIIFVHFENNDDSSSYIEIPQIYYRGYTAKSKKSNHYYYVDEGYNTWIRIYLGDRKEDDIKVYYRGTKMLRCSYVISGITWIGFIEYLIIDNKKTKLGGKKNEKI